MIDFDDLPEGANQLPAAALAQTGQWLDSGSVEHCEGIAQAAQGLLIKFSRGAPYIARDFEGQP